MATPNFATVNASKYFAFGLAQFTDEGEYDYELTQLNFDDAILNARSGLKELGWEKINKCEGRSYPARFFAEKISYWNYCGTEFKLTVQACAVSGYYEGATFDWCAKLEVDLGGWYGYEEYDLSDDLEKCCIEENWCQNRGLSKIFAKSIEKIIMREFEKITDECEKVFERNSERVLVCTGTFSNGEAVYADASSPKAQIMARIA